MTRKVFLTVIVFALVSGKALACGMELWSLKVLVDANAPTQFNPNWTTVAYLTSLPAPNPQGDPRALGPLQVGMSLAAVERRLGPGTRTRECWDLSRNEKCLPTLTYTDGKSGLEVAFGRREPLKVVQISAFQNLDHTDVAHLPSRIPKIETWRWMGKPIFAEPTSKHWKILTDEASTDGRWTRTGGESGYYYDYAISRSCVDGSLEVRTPPEWPDVYRTFRLSDWWFEAGRASGCKPPHQSSWIPPETAE